MGDLDVSHIQRVNTQLENELTILGQRVLGKAGMDSLKVLGAALLRAKMRALTPIWKCAC